MRWDALFADLELQLDAAAARDLAAEVADRTRQETSSVTLVDRLRAAPGVEVVLTTRSGAPVRGVVSEVGPAWVLLGEGAREHLVPLASLAAVSGLPGGAVSESSVARRRLGLAHALRGVSRDRSVVRVVAGPTTLLGRLDAVGADHVDVALVHDDHGRPTGARTVLALGALEILTRV